MTLCGKPDERRLFTPWPLPLGPPVFSCVRPLRVCALCSAFFCACRRAQKGGMEDLPLYPNASQQNGNPLTTERRSEKKERSKNAPLGLQTPDNNRRPAIVPGIQQLKFISTALGSPVRNIWLVWRHVVAPAEFRWRIRAFYVYAEHEYLVGFFADCLKLECITDDFSSPTPT